jgi:hypothetical protein
MNTEIANNLLLSATVIIFIVLTYKLIPKNKKDIKISIGRKSEEIKCPLCENKYLNVYKHCLVCGEINPNINFDRGKSKKNLSNRYAYLSIILISFSIVLMSYFYAIIH